MYIAALARGAVPAFAAGSKEQAVYSIAADLLESKRVSAANYAAGVAALGEVGVVELVSIVGYYSFVALTMNTFEIPDPQLPEGVNARASPPCLQPVPEPRAAHRRLPLLIPYICGRLSWQGRRGKRTRRWLSKRATAAAERWRWYDGRPPERSAEVRANRSWHEGHGWQLPPASV